MDYNTEQQAIVDKIIKDDQNASMIAAMLEHPGWKLVTEALKIFVDQDRKHLESLMFSMYKKGEPDRNTIIRLQERIQLFEATIGNILNAFLEESKCNRQFARKFNLTV